jgi:hypothetical protein
LHALCRRVSICRQSFHIPIKRRTPTMLARAFTPASTHTLASTLASARTHAPLALRGLYPSFVYVAEKSEEYNPETGSDRSTHRNTPIPSASLIGPNGTSSVRSSSYFGMHSVTFMPGGPTHGASRMRIWRRRIPPSKKLAPRTFV